MVLAAVTLTIGTVGVGAIYLPFIADKDRIRGLHEEGDMTPAEKREYEKMLRRLNTENSQKVHSSNSMWTRISQQSSSTGQK